MGHVQLPTIQPGRLWVYGLVGGPQPDKILVINDIPPMHIRLRSTMWHILSQHKLRLNCSITLQVFRGCEFDRYCFNRRPT